MKQKYFIDIHKGLTSVFILFLMYYFNSWDNLIAWIYLSLHGTYGILWILKSRIFPDKQWENKTSIWYGLFIWAGLSLYWVSPYIIITGNHDCNLNNSFRLDALTPIIKAINHPNIFYLKDTGVYKLADVHFNVLSVFETIQLG